jgi:hypothetical protein
VTLRARWVTLRARWVTLRARWVTLRARWVTLRARWVTFSAGCPTSSRYVRMTLGHAVPNDGSFTWTVPETFWVADEWYDSPLLRVGCDCALKTVRTSGMGKQILKTR